MSFLDRALEQLVDLGAEVAKDAIAGRKPSPEELALRLAMMGVEHLGEEIMRRSIEQAVATRVDADVDAAMYAKTGGR